MKLQANNEVMFEAATIEEMTALVKLFKDELIDRLWWEDEESAKAMSAKVPGDPVPGSVPGESSRAEEVRLAREYEARFGKRFYYAPHGAHKGQLRVEALREAMEGQAG